MFSSITTKLLLVSLFFCQTVNLDCQQSSQGVSRQSLAEEYRHSLSAEDYWSSEMKPLEKRHLKSQMWQHDYWFIKDRRPSPDDSKWDYCDYKCLYLENYASGQDFVVITFEGFLRDTFQACYVKSTAPTRWVLWSQVVKNDFFESHCGGDGDDWLKEDAFKIKEIQGEGLGVEISDDWEKQL